MTIHQGIQYIKNPYVFSQRGNDIDSLDNENYTNQINDSVKPVDKKFANIEAEQNEVLFEDGKLYNILGKPHSKGGTPLNAKEGSFIFSKFTPLAINKKDKKLFELNAIKSDKNKNNSPAQILKKEINLEHHNKMFKVLDDRTQDDISKKSAELMLVKNLDIVGKIGYLQEEKKNFPTGIPKFSNGTTPIVNKELENQIMQSKQFMQLGGMRKYALGAEVIDPLKCRYGTNPDGSCITYEQLSPAQKEVARKEAERVKQFSPNYTPVGDNVAQLVTPPTGFKLQGPQDPNWANTYKNLSPTRKAQVDEQARLQKLQREGDIKLQILDNNNSYITKPLTNSFNPGITELNLKTAFPKTPQTQPIDDLTPNDTLNYSTTPFNSNARLSGYQNANTAYLLAQGLNVKKYLPMRPQIRSNIPFVETLDYQPVLNQIDNGVVQQYDAGRFSSSPQQAALNSLIAGKALQAKSQAIGQINMQNVGIRNQQRQMASQILNGDNRFNIEQNAAYYDKTQMANSNYDTLKQTGINAAIGDLNTNRTMLDKFKQLEASQKMGQQYIRGANNTVELKDKDGKPEYFTEDELKTRKDEILKRGLIIQTKQVPLFSTDKYGRVVNNKIDVNPLGMAGNQQGTISFQQFKAQMGQERTFKDYIDYLGLSNGKNERQPERAVNKYGGKVSKRYSVKNPFN